jgi:hypothetical protein
MQVGAELFDCCGGVGLEVGSGAGSFEEIEQDCSTGTESPRAEKPARRTMVVFLIIVDRMKSCNASSVASGIDENFQY